MGIWQAWNINLSVRVKRNILRVLNTWCDTKKAWILNQNVKTVEWIRFWNSIIFTFVVRNLFSFRISRSEWETFFCLHLHLMTRTTILISPNDILYSLTFTEILVSFFLWMFWSQTHHEKGLRMVTVGKKKQNFETLYY